MNFGLWKETEEILVSMQKVINSAWNNHLKPNSISSIIAFDSG